MSSDSIRELKRRLAAQVELHREQEARHARQEEHFRALRSHHAAELAKALQILETFESSSTSALEMVAGPEAAAQKGRLDEDLDLGPVSRPKVVRMVVRVLEDLGSEERFRAGDVAGRVNQRFGARLRQPIDSRQVSFALRRMAQQGRLHLVRAGRPYGQALYCRTAPG
jgi:hypothetical protein